jgi:hypothetical protein
MADRRLAIEITVEGDAKSVFKEIGAAAKQSAKDVTDSGQRAQQGIERIEKAADAAEKEVKELGQTQERVAKSAEALEKAQAEAAKATKEMAEHSAKAKSSLAQYRQAISEASQGMALLGTAFTLYARQARDHEITVMAIQRMYGEAADSYISFADTIQNTTIFSNDEALEAARIMGTLRENYDLTDQQIQQLIQTSADLAAMHGFTLTDAAMRVQSAIRGEAESAEMLGLDDESGCHRHTGLDTHDEQRRGRTVPLQRHDEAVGVLGGFAAKASRHDMAGTAFSNSRTRLRMPHCSTSFVSPARSGRQRALWGVSAWRRGSPSAVWLGSARASAHSRRLPVARKWSDRSPV